MKNPNRLAYYLCLLSVSALIFLSVLWETHLAPLRPGGSWFMLKSIPLLMLMPGLCRARLKTFQKLSLVIWLYCVEGSVRMISDPDSLSRLLAITEFSLSLFCFFNLTIYLRHYKTIAK